MFDRDELERNLALNIGLMAQRLKEAGFDLSDMDKIGDEALKLIQNRAEQITADNPLQSQNVENIIIMVLMHGALVSQETFINDAAKELGAGVGTIKAAMIKDTLGLG